MRTVRYLWSTINVNNSSKLMSTAAWAIEKLTPEKYLEYLADQEIIDNYLSPYYANQTLLEDPIVEEVNTANGQIKVVIGIDFIQNVTIEHPPQFLKWLNEIKNHPDTITFRDLQIL